tara:strand:- start:3604 stop:4329 length:726 start_codon:yes stop_codon:yes gene_type:complete
MTKIIGISGRKQSGKNTVANFINGEVLKTKEMISNFNINDTGSLEVETTNSLGKLGWGVFDVTRKDKDFLYYAQENLWPFIKVYHFADSLKNLCVEFFDLKPEQVYGTDDDKNTKTPYTQNGWKHQMTAREFLQYFGTDVMRKIKDTVWVDYAIKMIKLEQSEIALIPDVRFPNEIEAIHKAGGIVIRLTRDLYSDDHRCESALDPSNYDWKNFDYTVNNHDQTLSSLQEELKKINHLWSK